MRRDAPTILLGLGLAVLVLSPTARLLNALGLGAHGVEVTPAAFSLAAVVVICAAVRRHDVDTSTTTGGLIGRFAALAVVAATATALVVAWVGDAAEVTAYGAAAGALLWAGRELSLRYPSTKADRNRWAGTAFVLVGTAEAVSGLAVIVGDGATLAACALRLAGVATALRGVAADLHRLYLGQRSQVLESLVDRHLVSVRSAAEDLLRRQLLHDLRSSAAVISTAMTTLDRYGPDLDPADVDQLRSAVQTQAARMTEVLSIPDLTSDSTVFDLFATLQPVWQAARRRTPVEVRLTGQCWVHGRPRQAAAIVQSALTCLVAGQELEAVEVHATMQDASVWLRIHPRCAVPAVVGSGRVESLANHRLMDDVPGALMIDPGTGAFTIEYRLAADACTDL